MITDGRSNSCEGGLPASAVNHSRCKLMSTSISNSPGSTSSPSYASKRATGILRPSAEKLATGLPCATKLCEAFASNLTRTLTGTLDSQKSATTCMPISTPMAKDGSGRPSNVTSMVDVLEETLMSGDVASISCRIAALGIPRSTSVWSTCGTFGRKAGRRSGGRLTTCSRGAACATEPTEMSDSSKRLPDDPLVPPLMISTIPTTATSAVITTAIRFRASRLHLAEFALSTVVPLPPARWGSHRMQLRRSFFAFICGYLQ
mmetsp:Transcript_13974/g.30188  ORF Transcript_13974/g.30188 Transcript_13974/m.30188 type:complete len:261 (-) Transcript_13974:277-1059(-)